MTQGRHSTHLPVKDTVPLRITLRAPNVLGRTRRPVITLTCPIVGVPDCLIAQQTHPTSPELAI